MELGMLEGGMCEHGADATEHGVHEAWRSWQVLQGMAMWSGGGTYNAHTDILSDDPLDEGGVWQGLEQLGVCVAASQVNGACNCTYGAR